MQTNRLAHYFRRLTCPVYAILIAAAFGASPANAGGTVGTGTPASCTRAAFNAALVGGGNVTFNCGAEPHTITLGLAKQIFSDTTIVGGNIITLRASNTNHFKVPVGTTLELENISLIEGKAKSGGAIENFGTTRVTGVTFANNTATESDGGAISNHGTLIVRRSTFSKNIGGAISNDEDGMANVEASEFNQNQGGAIGNAVLARGLTIVGSTFTDNFSPGSGGALVNVSIFGTVTVTLSTFSGNVAMDSGGAIFNTRNLTVESSTLIGNQAGGKGGGIRHFGDPGVTLNLTATTLNGNTANEGGGIYEDGSEVSNTRYTNSTLSGNESESLGSGLFHKAGNLIMSFTTVADNRGGAGIHVEGGTLSIGNTLLSNNTSNCAFLPSRLSSGGNLSSDASCPFKGFGDKNNEDARLGPLANNGGPTLTHLPQAGSPAIDAAMGPIDTDQRGIPRPRGPKPDIGSVEAQ